MWADAFHDQVLHSMINRCLLLLLQVLQVLQKQHLVESAGSVNALDAILRTSPGRCS